MTFKFNLQLFGSGGGGGGYQASAEQNRLFNSQANAMDSFNAYSEGMRNRANSYIPQNNIDWSNMSYNAQSQSGDISNRLSDLARGNIDISPMQTAINSSTQNALGSFAASHPGMINSSVMSKAMDSASKNAANAAAANWSAEGTRQLNTLNSMSSNIGQNIQNMGNIQTGSYMPFNTFTQAAFGGASNAAQMASGASQNTPTYVQNGGKF